MLSRLAALGLGALPYPTGLKSLAKPTITVEERGIRLSTTDGAEAWVEGQRSGNARSALSASNLIGALRARGAWRPRG